MVKHNAVYGLCRISVIRETAELAKIKPYSMYSHIQSDSSSFSFSLLPPPPCFFLGGGVGGQGIGLMGCCLLLFSALLPLWAGFLLLLFDCFFGYCWVLLFLFLFSYFCLYGPSDCISFHKVSRQLSTFSLCFSGFSSALLVFSTV